MKKILIIDDNKLILKTLKATLSKAGYAIIEAEDGEAGLHLARSEHPDLVITDYQMPGIDGLEVLSEIHKLKINLPVILLTGFGDIVLTIKSIQLGAFDYLEKPFSPVQLLSTIQLALNSVKRSNSLSEVFRKDNFSESMLEDNLLVGKAPQMKEIFKNIGLISMNKVNVLIQGDTGTGKELIARLIHFSGITRDKPLVVVNCSALTETLLESELFGHVKGSFTDSIRDKKGKFELAGEGTIFLDEISEISLNTQVKLLRVIQELEFEKVGGEATIPMKARIIAATNRNLEKLIQKNPAHAEALKKLREYRLDVLKNTIRLTYTLDYFDKAFNREPWQIAALSYGRKTKLGSVIARINLANRFGNTGFQGEMDAYPKISENNYGYLNYGFSQSTIFPKNRMGLEWYHNFPKSFEGSIGMRILYFNNSNVDIYTATLGKYIGNYWISIRSFVTPGTDGTSVSGSLQMRRYFSDPENYLGLRLVYGVSPDDNRNLVNSDLGNRLTLKTRSLRMEFNHIFNHVWIINTGAAWGKEERETGTFSGYYTFDISISRLF